MGSEGTREKEGARPHTGHTNR